MSECEHNATKRQAVYLVRAFHCGLLHEECEIVAGSALQAMNDVEAKLGQRTSMAMNMSTGEMCVSGWKGYCFSARRLY